MNQDNVVDDASSSSNEDTQAAPEHRYNLRNTDNIDYMSMRRFGETQLMQVQQEWVTQMQHKAKINNNKEPNSINMFFKMDNSMLYSRHITQSIHFSNCF